MSSSEIKNPAVACQTVLSAPLKSKYAEGIVVLENPLPNRYQDKECGICQNFFIAEETPAESIPAGLEHRSIQTQTTNIIAILPCAGGRQHPFHLSCIEEWFKTQIDTDKRANLFCPLCREVVPKKQSPYERLIEATKAGQLEVVQQLLEEEHFSKDDLGQAFDEAAIAGHLPVVQQLLEKGELSRANLNSALEKAAQAGHLPVVQQLRKEENISISGLSKSLSEAAKAGHLQIVQELLKDKILAVFELGKALEEAAKAGQLPVVQLLLLDKDRISVYHIGGALEEAAKAGHLAIVELLSKAQSAHQGS